MKFFLFLILSIPAFSQTVYEYRYDSVDLKNGSMGIVLKPEVKINNQWYPLGVNFLTGTSNICSHLGFNDLERTSDSIGWSTNFEERSYETAIWDWYSPVLTVRLADRYVTAVMCHVKNVPFRNYEDLQDLGNDQWRITKPYLDLSAVFYGKSVVHISSYEYSYDALCVLMGFTKRIGGLFQRYDNSYNAPPAGCSVTPISLDYDVSKQSIVRISGANKPWDCHMREIIESLTCI